MPFKLPMLLVIVQIMALLPGWAAAEPSKVAVVADAALEGSPLAEMIPAALAASDAVQTVERAALGAVIDEAMLARLVGDDRAARLEILRRMQVADALVVLRPVDLAGKPGIAVIVCEMQRGLRLLHRSLPADAGETGATLIAEEIIAHIAAASRPDVQIWAVPPPINRNLSYRYDHLQAAYAALVARNLTQAPNVLLVELSEARSLAQEQALGGGHRRRPAPAPATAIGLRTARPGAYWGPG